MGCFNFINTWWRNRRIERHERKRQRKEKKMTKTKMTEMCRTRECYNNEIVGYRGFEDSPSGFLVRFLTALCTLKGYIVPSTVADGHLKQQAKVEDKTKNAKKTKKEAKPKPKKWKKERMCGKTVGEYEIYGKMSGGMSGVVYTGDYNGQQRAIKIADGEHAQMVQTEFYVLRELHHDNIIKVFDCISTNKIVAMIMECATHRNMSMFLKECYPLAGSDMAFLGNQLVSAVKYIHNFGIVHLDIKRENLLISHKGLLKLIDFGSALVVRGDTAAGMKEFSKVGVTTEYLPPEIVCRHKVARNYSLKKIDAWAVGVVLFSMATHNFVFGESCSYTTDDYKATVAETRTVKLSWYMREFENAGHVYSNVTRQLLEVNPDNRLDVDMAPEIIHESFDELY